jgi:hypothetical protein
MYKIFSFIFFSLPALFFIFILGFGTDTFFDLGLFWLFLLIAVISYGAFVFYVLVDSVFRLNSSSAVGKSAAAISKEFKKLSDKSKFVSASFSVFWTWLLVDLSILAAVISGIVFLGFSYFDDMQNFFQVLDYSDPEVQRDRENLNANVLATLGEVEELRREVARNLFLSTHRQTYEASGDGYLFTLNFVDFEESLGGAYTLHQDEFGEDPNYPIGPEEFTLYVGNDDVIEDFTVDRYRVAADLDAYFYIVTVDFGTRIRSALVYPLYTTPDYEGGHPNSYWVRFPEPREDLLQYESTFSSSFEVDTSVSTNEFVGINEKTWVIGLTNPHVFSGGLWINRETGRISWPLE